MNVILYKSNTCPNCRMVKMKLEKKGIPFTEELDMDLMTNLGIKGIPTLEVDGQRMTNIRDINNWLNAQEDRTNG